jgi:HSP20 family molecular chaperone IbpA
MNPSDIFEHCEGVPTKQDETTSRKLCNPKRSITYHTVESTDSYKLLLDLPGIKESDIKVDLEKSNVLKVHAIRKLKNDQHITFEQKFYVDKKVANTSGATAVLENGVLTIQMVKATKVEPIIVEVKTSNNETDNDESKKNDKYVWTIDLPGVKSSDVHVKYHDDHVSIVATRKRGDNVLKIFKKGSISEEKFNVQLLQSFLVDGVLTITAPAVQENKKDTESIEPTVTNIPVLPHSSDCEIAQVQTSTDDNKSDDKAPFDDSVIIDH